MGRQEVETAVMGRERMKPLFPVSGSVGAVEEAVMTQLEVELVGYEESAVQQSC